MILDEIVASKREELAVVRAAVPLAVLQQRPLYDLPRREFRSGLQVKPRAIIAEVKKASPSKGIIRADFEPIAIARQYADGGAAAISVLTERKYFQGSLDYLAEIRRSVELPLLRKDFLFDLYQLHEARAYGADAILLIVAMLENAHLRELLQGAADLGLTALVEVHDARELERAQLVGATLIGINNRDLRTFHTTLETTERLLPLVEPGVLVVSESGIDAPADIQRLERQGVHAFLIGESLMRSPEPGVRLAELLR